MLFTPPACAAVEALEAVAELMLLARLVPDVPEKELAPVSAVPLSLAALDPKMPPRMAPTMIRTATMAAGIPYLTHFDFPFFGGAYAYLAAEACAVGCDGSSGRCSVMWDAEPRGGSALSVSTNEACGEPSWREVSGADEDKRWDGGSREGVEEEETMWTRSITASY